MLNSPQICYNVIVEQEGLLNRYEVFAAAAAIAAHSNHPEGFRQRDVRFFIELFGNWLELSAGEFSSLVSNTQVLRYLEALANGGFARRAGKRRQPLYKLTRVGLLELLSRIKSIASSNRTHFFFTYYFLKNYRSPLERLVRSQQAQFPVAMQLEFENLVDLSTLIDLQIAAAAGDLRRIEARISDAENTSELFRVRSENKVQFEQIVIEAQKRFPYDLNSRKPLIELIDSLPKEQQAWELRWGNQARVSDIWKPQKKLQEAYIDELRRIKKEQT